MKKINWRIILFSAAIIFPQAASAQYNPNFYTSLGMPSGSIYGIITGLLTEMLLLIGFIAVISFIIAGIIYLTAAGDEEQAKKAKRAMTYAILGIIVALAGAVVTRAAFYMLSGTYL